MENTQLNNCFIFTVSNPGAVTSGTKFMYPMRSSSERPYFEDISPTNVTAVVGQSVILQCRVKQTSDRTVSNQIAVHLFLISSLRFLIFFLLQYAKKNRTILLSTFG